MTGGSRISARRATRPVVGRASGLGRGVLVLGDIAVAGWAAPGLAASAYLAVLTALSRRPPARVLPVDPANLAIVVPAHNEEHQVGDTIRSLAATTYPQERRRIVVVADNCTDSTAVVARAAGAEVLERHDAVRKGKGFALAYAFEHLLADPWTDAVVIVDADTIVDANLLTALSARLADGADAVQADYDVRNVEDSWRTVLAQVAFTSFHLVRSEGRDRLGLSTGLRGNGMAFSRLALEQVPHDAFSVVEDLEYGLRLGFAGIRVHHAGEATVHGEMPTTGDSSRTQRQRWEGGRRAMRRRFLGKLVRESVRRRDPVLADLAVDVALPPLGSVVLRLGAAMLGATVLAFGAPVVGGRAPRRAFAVSGTGVGLLGVHVARGWQLSGTGARGLVALAQLPKYLAWKLTNGGRPWRSSTSSGPKLTDEPEAWVRTERSGAKVAAS